MSAELRAVDYITVRHIRTFLVAAESESFLLASKRLGVPQTFVSRTITTLEDALGVALFIRRKQGVRLTNAGQYLKRKWDGVPSFFESLAEAVRDG